MIPATKSTARNSKLSRLEYKKAGAKHQLT
jgi:hypothetical protein